MLTQIWIAIAVLLWLICAVATVPLALQRGRPVLLWGLLGLLLGPLALLYVKVAAPKPRAFEDWCPTCYEEIRRPAVLCPRCQADLGV